MDDVLIEPLVRAALLEDLGRGGDITTDAVVGASTTARAAFVARKAGVVAGNACAALALRMLDPAVRYACLLPDGATVNAGAVIATVEASARAVLTGERTALNFMCRLSGIATATRSLVDLVAGTHAKIACTRKTTPGLRALEKAAVVAGGGVNHRFGLDDAVLVKDNHIALAGGIEAAVRAVRAHAGHLVKIEVEVDSLEQLATLLENPVDAVLLDNMTPAQLQEAVRMIGGRMIAEASGNVTAGNVAGIARSGVDVISAGWITHSAPALDIGLDITA